MTDRPKMEWTDTDIRNAAETTDRSFVSVNVEYHRGFLKNLGAISPAECREREREAYLAGCAVGTTGEVFSHLPTLAQRETVNYRYPSLTPPPPPALTLSTGTWTQTGSTVEGNQKWSSPSNVRAHSTPLIYTASDARALAAWLAQYGSEEERK